MIQTLITLQNKKLTDQLKYFIDKINGSKKKWKILIGHHTLRMLFTWAHNLQWKTSFIDF